MRLILEVKNPTEELTGIYFFTLVVGYFAYAQYDVKSPIVGIAATSPEGGSNLFVIAKTCSDCGRFDSPSIMNAVKNPAT